VTFGFIGLGDMGLPMARRLLATGNKVVVWNRSKEKLESLIAAGAILAESPADVVLQADLIGLCVTSHQVVEHIAWGPSGLFASPLRGRKLIADFSTGSPASASAFARRAKTHGASWVDAPVSGGVPAAIAGTLIIFVGGEAESIASLQPLFEPISARVSHMGASGAGQITKICNQMIVASNLLLIGEMIALARKAGIDVKVLPAALKGGFADSLPLQLFGPRMAAHLFEPRLGAIALMDKDVGLASALSAEVNAFTPMLQRAHELYAASRIESKIDGAADISALIRLFEAVDASETK
jgi:3-hydroxyisobutyrate dehydrogenase-like beta-hydroxyacid dehydrogenase